MGPGSSYDPEDESVVRNENWQFLQLEGIRCHPRDGRWCPRYYQISSKIPFENEIPSQISSLRRPLQTQQKPKYLEKNLMEKKWWSKYVVGQNWKSVSSWNLSVSLHICPSLSLKFVSPWSVVGSCRLPKKRISTQIHVNHDWHQPCEPSNKDSLKIWDC